MTKIEILKMQNFEFRCGINGISKTQNQRNFKDTELKNSPQI